MVSVGKVLPFLVYIYLLLIAVLILESSLLLDVLHVPLIAHGTDHSIGV